jgi:hypothetical protein
MGMMSIADAAARSALKAEDATAEERTKPRHIDHLKFRIVTRKGRHYFRDVRYVNGTDGRELTHFLEGRALEELTPVLLRTSFNGTPYLPDLQTLVHDLQRVFCE